MSEYNIPFHIQEEIMKRLPVKSLIKFRSVSKAWKSLIDNSHFIAAHCVHSHTQSQRLLVSYENQEEGVKYVSYIDDDTFPQQRSVSTFPISDIPRFSIAGGSSHGLFCLFKPTESTEPGIAVFWNPSIRKSIVVPVPGDPSLGFGVCPVTCDPKIVAVSQSWDMLSIDKLKVETSYECEVMVYTLSSGKWRILSTNLPTKPTKPIEYFWCTMVTSRFIYWHAGSRTHNMITSFDVTNENFEVIDLPDSYAGRGVYFSKVRESILMVEYLSRDISTAWMMEHGVEKAFTKLFTIINTPHIFVVGFRKSGIPIVKVRDGNYEFAKLVVCEPNSEHNNVLEICRDNSVWIRTWKHYFCLVDLTVIVIDITQG